MARRPLIVTSCPDCDGQQCYLHSNGATNWWWCNECGYKVNVASEREPHLDSIQATWHPTFKVEGPSYQEMQHLFDTLTKHPTPHVHATGAITDEDREFLGMFNIKWD